jgi:membrane protein implicated in regulation of membrane protease activity
VTRRRRGFRLEPAEVPVPKRPYRDSAILYGVLALAIVLVAWLTGGGLVRAVVVALAFFVVATAWSWWRFRERLQRDAERR